MPKKNEVKVYGTVEAIKVANGVSWVKVIGIENDAGKELICYSDSMNDKFKGTILKAGDRLLIKAEKDKGKVSYVKLYVDKPKKKSGKDNTGMYVGHAIKGSTTLCGRFEGDLTVNAQLVHDLTRELHKEFLEKNPEVSEFESGNMVGNAVLNACYLADSVDDLKKFSEKLIYEVVPEVTSYIESGE